MMKKTLKANKKVEDLVAVVAKHTAKLAAVAASFVMVDSEIFTLWLRFGALSKWQLRTLSPLPMLTPSKATVLGPAFARGRPVFLSWARQAGSHGVADVPS